MIEERNTRNSQFDTQIKEYSSAAVPEAGGLMFGMGTLFYGDGYDFIPVANANNVPSNAWGKFYDKTYSSTSPQNLSVGAQKIVNNGGIVEGTLNDYNNNDQKFYFAKDKIYNVTINFTAKASSVTTHAQIFFGINSSQLYDQNSVLLNFAFQANVDHDYSATFQIVGNLSTEEDGLELFINPSATARLYGAKFTIQRFGYGI
jgi:hypothetical protein